MSVKISNPRLELNIKPFNNANNIAVFEDEKTINYIPQDDLVSHMALREYNNGLTLSNFDNRLIISEGSFYDKETEKLYVFNKPTVLYIQFNSQITENVTYNVYYNFQTNQFIYTNQKLTDGHKFIGLFRANNSKIINVFPTRDLTSSFEHHFVVKEQATTIGYRIYSDGWKEQWGNNANPVFPVAFENIPVITTVGATNITTTGMTITAGYWQAEGY